MAAVRLVILALVLCGVGLAPSAARANDAKASALATPPAPFRAPYVPAADGEILQEVLSSADPAVIDMRRLHAAFDVASGDLAAAIPLAQAYVDFARQIGDAHYAGYAEAVLAPWTTSAEPPVAVLLAQAAILQYRHQFAESRDLLQKVLRRDSHNGQAWLTLATLDMVQGDYAAAGRDCVQVTTGAGFQIGIACSGNVRSYIGQARRSLAMLQQSQNGGDGVPRGYQAWVEGLVAESAERLGDWPLAENHYLKALSIAPRDNFLLVAYADFLLDRSRPEEVLTLLADHAQSDTAFLRLALAQSALHSAQTQRYVWIMAARFEALTLRGSDFFGREQARFALQLQQDPKRALDLARSNWQVQREPWDTRLLLEAAMAAGQPEAALPALDFLQKSKLEDPVIESLAKDLRARLKPTGGSS